MSLTMKILLGFSFLLLNLLSSAHASLVPGPTCTDIAISVTVSANNIAIPIATTGPEIKPVTGTFKIAGRYCEPEFKVNQIDWSGHADPSKGYSPNGNRFSWISAASKQGYPTLAIDRLGNGLSDHPDPTTVVQLPLQIEIIAAMIAKIRDGTTSMGKMNKVIYVGHSFGSFIGNGLNAKYPDSADATILTGYTSSQNSDLLGPVFLPPTGSLVPAATWSPARFGTLDPGYLMLDNKTVFENIYYYSPFFTPAFLDLDFSLTSTVSLGELSSSILSATVAPGYSGPVFVITGQHDAVLCLDKDEHSAASSPTFNCGSHDTGYLAKTKSLYPASKSFDWYALPDAGHCWQFHLNAQQGFGVAHDWMKKQGF
jgi:pimeloyl-ACP methyl ester carboxylesterase